MVTVPRDSYVPIAGGGNGYKDKLTHAGIYGIEASIGTLANLFDLPIEAYARVNFSSVIQLVDAMGGITVENPRYFTTADYEFDEGSIRLNGDEALAFARERYGLADGDFERGRNQLRVIEAMFNEIIKPDNLLRFQSIMDVVREGVDTDLSADAMSALVRNQLASGASWTIERISVDGYGASGLESYAMPGWNLSMVVLEDDSLEAARDALRAALS